MTVWSVVFAAALVTYAIRISMVVVFQHRPMPTALEPVLSLATPAVLSAVIAGAVFLPDGAPGWPPLGTVLALAGAAVAVRRTGKPVLALAVGVPLAVTAALIGLG